MLGVVLTLFVIIVLVAWYWPTHKRQCWGSVSYRRCTKTRLQTSRLYCDKHIESHAGRSAAVALFTVLLPSLGFYLDLLGNNHSLEQTNNQLLKQMSTQNSTLLAASQFDMRWDSTTTDTVRAPQKVLDASLAGLSELEDRIGLSEAHDDTTLASARYCVLLALGSIDLNNGTTEPLGFSPSQRVSKDIAAFADTCMALGDCSETISKILKNDFRQMKGDFHRLSERYLDDLRNNLRQEWRLRRDYIFNGTPEEKLDAQLLLVKYEGNLWEQNPKMTIDYELFIDKRFERHLVPVLRDNASCRTKQADLFWKVWLAGRDGCFASFRIARVCDAVTETETRKWLVDTYTELTDDSGPIEALVFTLRAWNARLSSWRDKM